MNGPQIDPVAHHDPLWSRVGEDLALGVQQVHLDIGVDHHQHMEDVLQLFFADLAILHG